MPVVAKMLRPCPESKSTISGWTLFNNKTHIGKCNLRIFALYGLTILRV
jgi:hypothetical protein